MTLCQVIDAHKLRCASERFFIQALNHYGIAKPLMCGVVGLIGSPEAAREAFLGLTTLQHRGQDAAGILSYDAAGFHNVRNIGLVETVFTRENMGALTGDLAIGHARYATIGRGDINDVQPLLISYPFGIGMAHNGNIVNTERLALDLRTRARRHLLTHSDTEIVLNLFAEGLAKTVAADGADDLDFNHICEAVQGVFAKVNGSYSIVSLVAGKGLVAFRDPLGIRPLVWGRRKGGSLASGEAHMISSESVALDFLGFSALRNLAPGEVVYIDMKGVVHTKVLDQRGTRHCMFEWVYFASPESVIDDVAVYGARINLGKSLAGLVRKALEARGRHRRACS
jgi:amidophosphoribosyltransferase